MPMCALSVKVCVRYLGPDSVRRSLRTHLLRKCDVVVTTRTVFSGEPETLKW